MQPIHPLHTRLCDLLDCRYPILQAGMGGVARSELVAAVSEAGGYGFLGMVREPPDVIRREIQAVRDRTDRPFGVNLIPAATAPGLFAEELAACLEAGVHALTFFWDVDADAVARARHAGCCVLYQVGSVADAMAAEAAGADAIIAQGLEAGGHVRGHIPALTLVPQVAAAVSVPVVASGGFVQGRSLVAALALGAQGIHCGTAFLATRESYAHTYHKERLLAASAQDTVYTDAFTHNWPPHAPVRVLQNSLTEALGGRYLGCDPRQLPCDAIAQQEGHPLLRYSTDSPLRNTTGDLEAMALYAGQGVDHVRDTPSARERLEAMLADAEAALERLLPHR